MCECLLEKVATGEKKLGERSRRGARLREWARCARRCFRPLWAHGCDTMSDIEEVPIEDLPAAPGVGYTLAHDGIEQVPGGAMSSQARPQPQSARSLRSSRPWIVGLALP